MPYVPSRVLIVIAARSGSKRIKGKNFVGFNGKPLLFWTIQVALGSVLRLSKSGRIKAHAMISTDSTIYGRYAAGMGIEFPYVRPARLSTDDASSYAVLRHALLRCEGLMGIKFDQVVLLQPTSPLRSSNDIVRSVKMLESSGADAVVSVCSKDVARRVGNCVHVTGAGSLRRATGSKPPNAWLNGAVYALRSELLRGQPPKSTYDLISAGCMALRMPYKRSIDIDTSDDLREAIKVSKMNARTQPGKPGK